jgi:CheY-like chemotaxis protein
MAEPMAKKYSVTVLLDESCNDLPVIKTDQSRFKQVLLNILSNAIKYNNRGGTVCVSCQAPSAGILRFKVKDTGIGIPASRYSELFTPFHRLGAEGGPIEGAGIGLSMTKQLIRMMSGKIGFDSEEGKGSLFWFDLPVSENMAVVPLTNNLDIKPVARLGKEKNFRILYIEDNPSNQSLMQGVLTTLPGVELECIHNAEMGLDYIAHEVVDLVLMDIDLPGMNGIEATKLLKQDESTRHIPVIAITANAMQADIDYAKTVGFDHYLTKPYDISEILSVVSAKFNQ